MVTAILGVMVFNLEIGVQSESESWVIGPKEKLSEFVEVTILTPTILA